jgi:hypothetical protein
VAILPTALYRDGRRQYSRFACFPWGQFKGMKPEEEDTTTDPRKAENKLDKPYRQMKSPQGL